MRWLWLFSVGLISGCGSGAVATNPCAKRLQVPPEPTIVLALERQPLTVSLDFPLVIACAGGNPVATSVETQVLDPRQQPVPHAATPPTSPRLEGYSTSVTFTPDAPGLYALSARFEPGLGIARREVLVMVDRLASVPVGAFHAAAPCEGVTELGPFTLCASAARGVDVFVDGGLATTWPAELASFAPGAAWTVVERARDALDGGGRRPRVGVDGGPTLGAVGLTYAATDDALQVVAGATFTEVVVDGGALEVRRHATLPVASSGRSGLLVPGGDALAFDAVALDGGPLRERRRRGRAQRVSRAAGAGRRGRDVHAAAPRARRAGRRRAVAAGVGSGRVGLLRYVGDAPPPSVTFLAAQPSALVDQGTPLPLFTQGGRAIVVSGRDFLLEAFPLPMGRVKAGVSTSHVWFSTADGRVTLYRR